MMTLFHKQMKCEINSQIEFLLLSRLFEILKIYAGHLLQPSKQRCSIISFYFVKLRMAFTENHKVFPFFFLFSFEKRVLFSQNRKGSRLISVHVE